MIDGETFAELKKEDSMWTLDDGKLIHIVIEKVRRYFLIVYLSYAIQPR